MAVDRGGLQYTIRLRDEFSKTTTKFRAELKASKAAFAEFQRGVSVQKQSASSFKKTSKEIDEQALALKRLAAEAAKQRALEREAVRLRNTQQRDATRATNERLAAERAASKERAKLLKQETRDQREAANARKRLDKEQAAAESQRRKEQARALLDQQKALKGFADAQARREKESARISQQQRKDEKAVREVDPQFQAQKRLNSALREEAIARAQINLLRQRAASQFSKGDIIGGARSLRQAKDLKDSLDAANKSGNSLFFTFRRLIGVLAVFTIARNVVQGFQDLVRAGLDFNNTIESAKTSIAGLVVAVADVRSEFGTAVGSAEEFELALRAADDQIKKLQKDSLKTTVSFKNLVETFQVAIAPGFGAGLNIDQIRKFTVDIAQAAQAIGLEQNQLAEEIRSILAGTIQARTTRIATALGITNADIRRLKETGKLFEFLEDRFAAFNAASERLVRSTLGGIRNLITNIVQQILGKAAEPLFKELIRLGNELFDNVLTVRDALGNLEVNPEIVAAFRAIFDALREGVLELERAFDDIDISDVRAAFEAAGTALSTGIKFAVGFGKQLFDIFTGVAKAVQAVAGFFKITNREVGKLASSLGSIVAITLVWNNTVGRIGLGFGNIFSFLSAKIPGALKGVITRMGIWGGILAVLLTGFDLVLRTIFDVNLSLAETAQLIGLGLLGGLENFKIGLKAIANQFKGAFSLQTQEQIDLANMKAVEESKARQLEIDKKIAAIITKAAERENLGEGFGKDIQKAVEAGTGLEGIISGIDSEVKKLDARIQELDDQLFEVGNDFAVAFDSQPLEGLAGEIQQIFNERTLKRSEDLRKISATQANVQQQIARIIDEQNISIERREQLEQAASGNLDKQALQRLQITKEEAQLVSLLIDQATLAEAIGEIDERSLAIAQRKAAVRALEATRTLQREAVLLREQAGAEQQTTDVVVRRLGARRAAVVAAENELRVTRAQHDQAQQALQDAIDFLKVQNEETNQTGEFALTPAQRQANEDAIAALEEQLELHEAIGEATLARLEAQRQEAALIESGTLGQGLSRGFEDLATELPTAFEAGVTIVKQSVTALADFISSSIVAAFDPTDDTSLTEKFARFLQGIAQLILQQLVQLAIAAALQKSLADASSAAVQTTAATTAAAITVDASVIAAANTVAAAQAAALIQAGAGAGFFHSGGLVKGYNRGGPVSRAKKAAAGVAHTTAAGFSVGGVTPPPHVHPLDTVPAWLQPGEFVVRKSKVDQFGLDFFKAINNGSFAVPRAAPPSGAHAAEIGMAKGGLVSDQAQRAAVSSSGKQGEIIPLPVLVAGEKEADRLYKGGRSAFLQMVRENAGSIKGLLK